MFIVSFPLFFSSLPSSFFFLSISFLKKKKKITNTLDCFSNEIISSHLDAAVFSHLAIALFSPLPKKQLRYEQKSYKLGKGLLQSTVIPSFFLCLTIFSSHNNNKNKIVLLFRESQNLLIMSLISSKNTGISHSLSLQYTFPFHSPSFSRHLHANFTLFS